MPAAAGSWHGYTLYKIKNSREEMTNDFINALIKYGKAQEPTRTAHGLKSLVR